MPACCAIGFVASNSAIAPPSGEGVRVAHERVEARRFNGGSTGPARLAQRIAARWSAATVVRGDRLASVARGLGAHALRAFGAGR